MWGGARQLRCQGFHSFLHTLIVLRIDLTVYEISLCNTFPGAVNNNRKTESFGLVERSHAIHSIIRITYISKFNFPMSTFNMTELSSDPS